AARAVFLLWSVFSALLAEAAAPADGAPSSAASALQERCRDLRNFALPGLRVDAVRAVPAGAMPAPTPSNAAAGIVLPAHCLFQGTLGPRTGPDGLHFGIGLELRLPESWNGAFVFQGGGGLDGVLSPSYGAVGGAGPPALVRGIAIVSTDGGHRSGSMSDARFALYQPGRIDYAYNAVDKTTLLAKALIARYYGQAPRRSYFIGCSNGGRQAMIAAERLPMEF